MNRKELIKNTALAAAILGAALSITACASGNVCLYGSGPDMDTEAWEESDTDTEESTSITEETETTADYETDCVTGERLIICYYGSAPEDYEE